MRTAAAPHAPVHLAAQDGDAVPLWDIDDLHDADLDLVLADRLAESTRTLAEAITGLGHRLDLVYGVPVALDSPEPLIIMGVQPGGLADPSREASAELGEPGDAIVDSRSGLHVGDTVRIGRSDLRVVATVDDWTMLGGVPIHRASGAYKTQLYPPEPNCVETAPVTIVFLPARRPDPW